MKRVWKWTKRLAGLGIVLGILSVPAVYFGLPAVARHERARLRVEKALSRAVATPVRIDRMAWSWKEGLVLKSVSGTGPSTSFQIDTVIVKPDLSRIYRGKLRARAVVDGPEIVVRDAGTARPEFRLPRVTKRGLRLESVEIRNGTYVWESAAYGETVRIEAVNVQAFGRLRSRTLSLEMSDFSGRVDGKAAEGKGELTVTGEGVTGALEITSLHPEGRTSLQRALQAANIAVKTPSPASEPF